MTVKGDPIKRIGERMLANLKQVSTGRVPYDAGSSAPGQLLYLLHAGLRPETLTVIRDLHPKEQSIADRWASNSEWKNKLLELEHSGNLIRRLQRQATFELRAISDARVAGQWSDLPDSEILETHGIDPSHFLYLNR